MADSELIACSQCDYLHLRPTLNRQEKAYCTRCGATLGAFANTDFNTAFALTLTGLIVWFLAVTFPIASVIVQDHHLSATLISIVQTLNLQQYTALAFLIVFTLALSPLLELVTIGFVLWQLNLKLQGNINHNHLALVAKLRRHIKPWVLIDVFMLGVLVAVVKLKAIVIVEIGAGLWAFIALIIILYYLSYTLNITHDEQ
jgi:paraquat-inducible protein A